MEKALSVIPFSKKKGRGGGEQDQEDLRIGRFEKPSSGLILIPSKKKRGGRKGKVP